MSSAARSKRYRTRQALGLRVYKVAANERELRTALTRTGLLDVGASEEEIRTALEKLISDMVEVEMR